MQLRYTPLYDLVAPNTNSQVVLNKEFRRWEEHITQNFQDYHFGGNRYSSGMDIELFSAARAHAANHQRPTDAPMWITLTHPLYMFMTHPNYLDREGLRKDAYEYAHYPRHPLLMPHHRAVRWDDTTLPGPVPLWGLQSR